MTTEDRRKRERKQRRRQILQAARDLILERGYDQTSMQQIADRAEVSKGTLYLYYENKDALFLAINKFVLEEIQKKFREVMKQDRDGFWLVEHLGGALIECIQAHPEYLKALTLYDTKVDSEVFDDHPCKEEYEEIVQELLMSWTRAIQIGMQDGSIAADTRPRILAIQLGYGIRGMLQLYNPSSNSRVAHSVIKEQDKTIENIISQFIRVLLNGIRPPSKS